MNVTVTDDSAEWYTPRWLVDQLADEFGEFDLDPCATAESAKAPAWYTRQDNGLALPWYGRCWMNPPYGYGVTGQWVAKARREVDAGHADLVVALLPARTDAQWFTGGKRAASLVRYWPGRISFERPGGGIVEGNAPRGNVVMVFGTLTGRHGTEHAICIWCRRVFWPAQRNRETCTNACRQAKWRYELDRESVTRGTR